jgi:cob(I)alamin adenosyltransferase
MGYRGKQLLKLFLKLDTINQPSDNLWRVKTMSITTKKGDDGVTSIIGNSRVSKSSIRPEALGTVDELSSYLGLIYVLLEDSSDAEKILSIQQDLYRISSELASDGTVTVNVMFMGMGDVSRIEDWSKSLEKSIEPLKNLIIPGGGNILSANLDIGRTICRRAERRIVSFFNKISSPDGDLSMLKYLNRLSDYLFLLARKYDSKRIYVGE